MKSMTGYGSASVEADVGKLQIEIRSENHRYLDIKIYSPDFLNGIEGHVTDVIRKNVTRGKLRVKFSIQENKKNKNRLLVNHFKDTFDILRKIRKELKIDEQVSIQHLLLMKDYLAQEITPEITDTILKKILSGLKRALKEFDSSKIEEGKKLQTDILGRIENLKKLAARIKKNRESYCDDASNKLRQKIEELTGNIDLDESRLIQEIAYLTERTEITEELVRLDAHLSRFAKNANKNGAIGKELDFLVQEMNRESGTISAKCKDADISHSTIELRSELEKIREQIQNIE